MQHARQQAPTDQLLRCTKMSYRRFHTRLQFNSLAIIICLLYVGLASTNAAAAHFYQRVPAFNRDFGGAPALLRLTRDLSTKLKLEKPAAKRIASTAEPLLFAPVDQPQGQCLLDGALVLETSATCGKQVGCRAIQKTGYCCPDYKCDCQKDGKTYLNGDKLVDPETPCTVCYCQGGEILCSSVTCFYRDDCKPKYIQGRCCPEYDNCPVSIFDPSHNANKSNNPPTPAADDYTTASSPATPAVANNPKITIKEITKPTEIRITDDNKAIPIHQMLKPQATTTTSTTTTTTTTEKSPTTTTAAMATVDRGSSTLPSPTPTPTSSVHTPTTESNLDQNQSGESAPVSTTASTNANTGGDTHISTDNNRQTLLPLPMTGGINSGESLKLSASVAYPSTERNTITVVIPKEGASAENASNDSGEVSAEVAPLVEDGNTIPAFGAQELQHDASSNDPTKVNIKRENFATTERETGALVSEEFASPELIDSNGGGQSGGLQLQGTFDLEPETSGSDNIYHIILTTTGPRVTENADGFADFKTTEDLQHSSTVDIQAGASNPQQTVVLLPPQTSKTTDAPPNSDSTSRLPTAAPTTANPASSSSAPIDPLSSTDAPELSSTSTEATKHSTDSGHHIEDEETAIPVEANPAYPSLPEDDFSLRDVNFPANEADEAVETDVKDEQRSIGGAFEDAKSHKPAEEGSGVGIELIEGSSTAVLLSSDSTTETASKRPTMVALLMNSAEDMSGETAISNSTDFQLDRLSRLANDTTNDSAESLEAQLESEAGSGDSLEAEKKLEQRREPTTPRPKPHGAVEVDIDELGGNASGDGNSDPKEDPKLDAESIKADENVEEGIIKQEAGEKEDVLTVNAKPTEERTAEEVPAATLGRLQQLFLQRFV